MPVDVTELALCLSWSDACGRCLSTGAHGMAWRAHAAQLDESVVSVAADVVDLGTRERAHVDDAQLARRVTGEHIGAPVFPVGRQAAAPAR